MKLTPGTTALVLIDLQNGIVGMPTVPRSGPEVVASAARTAKAFHEAGALVVATRVSFSADLKDAPPNNIDQPMKVPPGGMPEGFATLVPDIQPLADIVITKHQWGAFTGTELDLQLRRRGIRTLALGGIATNFGVESTARQAWELGYDLVILEDLCSTSAPLEAQTMAFKQVFPRLARVTTSDQIAFGADAS